jgi:tRNA A-37 threonylcarbamoyl transferase component Bud32
MAANDAREEIEDALTHIIPHKPFPQYIDDTVILEVKELLTQHPDARVSAWKDKPRLYTLLRMLDYHEGQVFARFEKEFFGDFWLPLGLAALDQLATTAGFSASQFRRAQLHILSRPEQMSEEKLFSTVHIHRHIQYGNSHFEEKERIGVGGSAEVVRVKHKLSGREFACKRILRKPSIQAQRNQLIEFEQEVGVLQKISHPHFVCFVASFTDLASFSLILEPVASDVLTLMLERQTRDQPLSDTDVSTLRQSLGCLSTAVAYLHQQKVRHKDIKPGNILVSGRRVLLCDFGVSLDWSNSEHSTTEGIPHRYTYRYSAPEVKDHDRRNSKSDVWSLGCVFLEIITVIKGYTIDEFHRFLIENNTGEGDTRLWYSPEAMRAWIEEIQSENHDSADDLPLSWIIPMVRSRFLFISYTFLPLPRRGYYLVKNIVCNFRPE